MRLMGRFFTVLGVSVILAYIAGCAPATYRANPELDARIKSIKTIGVIPADIRIYEMSAGDVEELRDDWSDQGKENVTKSLEGLKNHNVQVKRLTIRKDLEDEMEDIQALYWAVSASILNYTYNEEIGIPEKRRNFLYSVGPMKKFLDAHGVDAVLLVNGYDEISSGGRKVLRALSMLTSIITGTKRPGRTGMSIALVDRSGFILWYNIDVQEGGYDLRKADSAQDMVHLVLKDFPEAIK